MKRRALLTTVGTGLVATAGCLDTGDGRAESTDERDDDTDQSSETDAEGEEDQQIDERDGGSDDSRDGEDEENDDGSSGDFTPSGHVSARDVENLPTQGSPAETPGSIIEFTDPACDVCASFHAQTFRSLREELVDSGEVSFISRMYPSGSGIWPEVASAALVATHEQDFETFWDLKYYYYENQSALNRDNVHERTEAFLSEYDTVDANGIVDAVRDGEYDEYVEANIDAAQNAGTGRTTPTFYLFRDGEYVTEITGHQNTRVFRSALDL